MTRHPVRLGVMKAPKIKGDDISLPSYFLGLFISISHEIKILGGGFKYFHPYLGKISILTNIFQMG